MAASHHGADLARLGRQGRAGPGRIRQGLSSADPRLAVGGAGKRRACPVRRTEGRVSRHVSRVSAMLLEGVGDLTLAIWIYLIAFRGGFWRLERLRAPQSEPPARSVVAVIPARDEADMIGGAIASLL